MCAQLTSRTREALNATWLDGIRVVDLTLDTLTTSPRLVRLHPYLSLHSLSNRQCSSYALNHFYDHTYVVMTTLFHPRQHYTAQSPQRRPCQTRYTVLVFFLSNL